jgi:uncharacterized caspase-like protein
MGLATHPALAAAPGRGTSYALLVACDKYDEKQLRSLQFTRNDILGLQNILLESGFKADHIVVLHEEQPSELLPERRKVLEQLKLLLGKVGEADSLVVALSGHGVQFKGESRHYFCPRDANLDDRDTLIDMSDVYKKMAACPSTRKLLIVDACRNDPRSRLSKAARPTLELESVTRPQAAKIPEGLVALFSCAEGQESFEDPELQHGVFFYHVLKGWHQGAVNEKGQVQLHDLIRYAVKETKRHTEKRLDGEQVPEQKNQFAETWTLTQYSGEIRQMTAKGLTSFNSVHFARHGRWVVACTRGDGDYDKAKATDTDSKRPELLIWDAVSGRLLRRWTIRAGVA